jgi:hypothetical protein
MCARRFLIAIFILVLLAVAAAFAIFEFGDRALTRIATPQGHYAPPPPTDPGPDYSQAANWLARPGLAGDSEWRPDGVAGAGQRDVQVFSIHPTTYLDNDRWNAPLLVAGDPEFRARLFIRSQASAFNAVGEVWSPRYRQAAFGAFLLNSADSAKALDLAYRDVARAFDEFIAEVPRGTPILLAGHSQGALHLSRLLADRSAAIKDRLVAAYVVGWPLSRTADLPAMHIGECRNADQAACVLSWQSFGEPSNPALILGAWAGTRGPGGVERRREDIVCTNPLTGTANAAAPPSANRGTLLPTVDFASATLEPGRVGARCDRGVLIVNGAIPPLGPYVLPGNNYHVYDFALFWGSIRADAARRLAAWTR